VTSRRQIYVACLTPSTRAPHRSKSGLQLNKQWARSTLNSAAVGSILTPHPDQPEPRPHHRQVIYRQQEQPALSIACWGRVASRGEGTGEEAATAMCVLESPARCRDSTDREASRRTVGMVVRVYRRAYNGLPDRGDSPSLAGSPLHPTRCLDEPRRQSSACGRSDLGGQRRAPTARRRFSRWYRGARGLIRSLLRWLVIPPES
jgi:hypothetical protein